MIDFTEKTYRNLLREMLSRIPDTYDKRDTASIPTALGPAAYALEGICLSLNQIQQMAFIQTAVGQSLDYLAALGGGVKVLLRAPAGMLTVKQQPGYNYCFTVRKHHNYLQFAV